MALLAIEPSRVLDLGCQSGYQLPFLQKTYPEAPVVGVDPAPGNGDELIDCSSRWSRFLLRTPALVSDDPHHLLFADRSIDLAVFNVLYPVMSCAQVSFYRVESFRLVERSCSAVQGQPIERALSVWATIDAHLHGFVLILDMRDLGDSMLSAWFAAPVLDRENTTIDYPPMDALQDELNQLGAAYIHHE